MKQEYKTGIDNCATCKIPEDPRYNDIESEYYFTCADCPCYRCFYLHNCDGQCAQANMEENE